MKTFKVTYRDEVLAETEEEAYVQLLEYLAMCVSLRDVTAFGFTQEPAPKGKADAEISQKGG